MLDSFTLLARNNQFMNQRMLSAAAKLNEAQLKEDRGAFFGSVLGTLNHILVADIVWLKRFQSHTAHETALTPVADLEVPATLNAMLCDDLSTLSAERALIDALIVSWVNGLSEQDIDGALRYSDMSGAFHCKAMESLMCHFFLHQTHHRGQVTTLLAQFGIDYGATDLLELIDPVTGRHATAG